MSEDFNDEEASSLSRTGSKNEPVRRTKRVNAGRPPDRYRANETGLTYNEIKGNGRKPTLLF